jgi:tetratricopeptide (TPR) repeat protein
MCHVDAGLGKFNLPRRFARPAATLLLGALSLAFMALACYAGPAVDQANKLTKEGKPEEARALLLDAVKQNPLDHGANFALAKIYLREQAYDKAVEFAERAVKLADSVAVYHLWLARANLGKAMKSGMFAAFMAARKGLDEYERAVALDPLNLEARFEMCMYYLIAPGVVGGSEAKAKENAAVLQSQSEIYGAYAWASYWEKQKNLVRAESLLVKAAAIDTSSASTGLYGLGYFYERHEKPGEAAGVFKQLLAKKPDDLVALYNLGSVYVDAKTNLDEAEAAFKRYLAEGPVSRGPAEASVHWRLGLVYDLQGKPDSALVELKRAVELAPGVKQFKDTLKQAEKKQQHK